MGKIIIERWKNSIATSKAFGKYFGRFKPNGTLDTRQVAQHIQERCSQPSPLPRVWVSRGSSDAAVPMKTMLRR